MPENDTLCSSFELKVTSSRSNSSTWDVLCSITEDENALDCSSVAETEKQDVKQYCGVDLRPYAVSESAVVRFACKVVRLEEADLVSKASRVASGHTTTIW